MEVRSIFLNLSPLDHRYYLSNRQVFEELSKYLSEEANIRYCLRVEVALLESLLSPAMGLAEADSGSLSRIRRLAEEISPEEVYEEEGHTHHNIRALVNVMKRKVPAPIRHLVHLGATSVDILDTALSLRVRDSTRRVILPLLLKLMGTLIDLTLREASTPQIGRTHGQFAVPITFGYALAEYVSRLGKSIERIERKSTNLRGKLAGAVGAYNAMSLIVEDPENLEVDFLGRLGLGVSEHSTQLVEPEYLLELLLEINTGFGIIANLADDLRNLQRSELGEVRELFSKEQVGSSTMPQKRNPWNSEHVKSLWKAFSPRVMTMFMDQISDHQRDLTNSASSRFITDYLTGFSSAVNRMAGVLASLHVDRVRMLRNLRSAGDLVLAEAVYILLSLTGDPQGHERVRRLTLEADEGGKSLGEVLGESPETFEQLSAVLRERRGGDLKKLFSSPEMYCGISAKKAERIALKYREKMAVISSSLGKTE